MAEVGTAPAQLFVLAWPVLAEADRRWIDGLRAAHDPQHALVAPHFTLVFGARGLAPQAMLAHVAAVAQRHAAIDFRCRYAMPYVDALGPRGHVFLVPDEGYAALSRLHDALYAGPLAPQLRLDLPFVPHITLGALAERAEAWRLYAAVNAGSVDVAGRVDALATVALVDGVLRELGRQPLTPAA